MWLSILLMYSINILTLRAAFTEIHSKHLLVWLPLDYLLDLFNIFDIFLHTRLAYMKDGILETNIRRIKRHYFHSYSFAMDILAVIPIDVIFASSKSQPALRLNRLFKVHRMLKFIEKAESSTTYPNTLRLSLLVIFMFTVIHLNACLYFKVSEAIGKFIFEAIPYHNIPHHTMQHRTTPHHNMPHHTTPYHTMPQHTTPY